MFVSFDGLDGVGKSTQMTLFEQWLVERGHEVVHCVDPGTTPLGEAIRAIVLGHDVPIARTAEMLLFMAARAQLVDEVVRPAIEQGKVVVSDRYVLANIVYQGHAGGLDVEMVRRVGEIATRGMRPDLVLLLDMEPEDAARRMTGERDRMEMQGAEYTRRLRAGFLAEAARDPARIVVIDAGRDREEVQQQIRAAAERHLATAARKK